MTFFPLCIERIYYNYFCKPKEQKTRKKKDTRWDKYLQIMDYLFSVYKSIRNSWAEPRARALVLCTPLSKRTHTHTHNRPSLSDLRFAIPWRSRSNNHLYKKKNNNNNFCCNLFCLNSGQKKIIFHYFNKKIKFFTQYLFTFCPFVLLCLAHIIHTQHYYWRQRKTRTPQRARSRRI